MAPRIRAVRLPLNSDAVEQTEDLSVFIISPKRQHRRLRKHFYDRAKEANSPGSLAALGLPRANSEPTLPRWLSSGGGGASDARPNGRSSIATTEDRIIMSDSVAAFRRPIQRGRSASAGSSAMARGFGMPSSSCEQEGDGGPDEEQPSTAATTRNSTKDTTDAEPSDSSGDEAKVAEDDSDSSDDTEESDDDEEEEEDQQGDVSEAERLDQEEDEELRRGIMQRAAEQTMVINLKYLAQRQHLRYGSLPAGNADDDRRASVRRRMQSNELGTDFTHVYSNTLDILENYMTLTPPHRRHSHDLNAYGGSYALRALLSETTTAAAASRRRSDDAVNLETGMSGAASEPAIGILSLPPLPNAVTTTDVSPKVASSSGCTPYAEKNVDPASSVVARADFAHEGVCEEPEGRWGVFWRHFTPPWSATWLYRSRRRAFASDAVVAMSRREDASPGM